MSFLAIGLVRVGGTAPKPIEFTYKSTDSKTTILGNGYFNSAATTLKASDIIVVFSSGPVFTLTVIVGTDSIVRVSEQRPIKLPLSAFKDLRTAELHPQFQYSFEYTVDNTELTTNTITNSGTVTQANAMAVIGSGTTTDSTALLQSARHAKYKSGFGGLLRYTDLFTAPVEGTSQLIGLADELGSTSSFKNGLMIGYDKNVNNGTVFGFFRYANDVTFAVDITDWDDPLDGFGPSGDTLVPTNLNVNGIRFQFLGAGLIELERELDIGGDLEPAHLINYSNRNTQPSSFNPNYFATIFVDNGITTSNMVLKSSSLAYFVEGKTDLIELQQLHHSSGIQVSAAVTGEIPLFTIRNKTSYASKTNFIDIVLELFTGSIEATSANNLGQVRLVKNATLGGTPAYADINTTNSVVEIDVAATSLSGGIEIPPFLLAGKNDKIVFSLTEYDIILAPGETMTAAGTSVSSATMTNALMFKELF